MNDSAPSADKMPIPAKYKSLVTDYLIARRGATAPNPQTLDVLWRMVESATWYYRQQVAAGEAIDGAAVSERATRLTEQLTSLGLDDRSIADIFDALTAVGVCPGFVGIARDLTPVPATNA